MKTKKIWPIILIVILIATAAGIVIFNSTDTARFRKQLNLGQRYLSEMNYEEAVVAFNQAIEIDPRNVDAYLGLADAYVGLGDEEAALAALKKGYEATGDERLKARIDEMEAAAEESNTEEIDESNGENDEITRRMREISDLIRGGDGGVGEVNSDGSTHLLTYDQIEAAYRPLAEELEGYLENEQGEWETDAYYQLAAIYLHLGEMEKCLEVRRKGYEITGGYGLRPEVYESEDGGLVYDEYGRNIGTSGDSWSYGEADRYITWDLGVNEFGNYEQYQYAYDSQGRIIKVYSTSDGRVNYERTFEYQGDNSVMIVDDYETVRYSSIITYNEYGIHLSETERVEVQ